MTAAEKKYQSLDTGEKIDAKVKSVKGLFKSTDKDKMRFLDGLIYQFAVTTVTLERLVDELNQGDILEDFSQGSQKFKRENPALKSYNTTIKSFTALSKALLDLLPEQASKTAGEALLNFATKPPGADRK